MNLSAQINKYRKAANLTQEQLAAELGVSSQAVSKWERGGSPDIGMLPIIANYFHITIDELLENDTNHIMDEKNEFWYQLHCEKDVEKKIRLLTAYRRKYPHDIDAMNCFLATANRLSPEKRAPLLPTMRMICERILAETNDSDSRNTAIWHTCRSCPEEEREEWASLLPRIVSMRCQNLRTVMLLHDGNIEDGAARMEILMLLQLKEHFANRIPDQLGPERKRRQSLYYMGILELLADEKRKIPDGWLSQYAYERLVLSTTLFALGNTSEAWMHFERAMEDFRKWYALPDGSRLDTGFDGITVSKNHFYAFFTDKSGTEQREIICFSNNGLESIKPAHLHHFLTCPEWEWLDSARDDPRYTDAVAWVKALADKQPERGPWEI